MVLIRFVVPPVTPGSQENIELGRYRMSVVPRLGEVVSLQSALGGERAGYRIQAVIYNMPDMGPDELPDVEEATAIVDRIVTPEDLQKAVALAWGNTPTRQATMFDGRKRG